MGTQTSSNCLKQYKKINVEIITTAFNTTAYQLKQTQGAEYGEEAENVRQRFEASMRSSGITISEASLEAFQNFLNDECDEMEREDYKDLLHQIVGECNDRLNAMIEEDAS